jgi:hypothetical protein
MTDLDDVFGKRTESVKTILPTRTNWPTAHESIRPILDKFDELQGGTPRSVECRRVRQASARAWIAEFGENSTELLALAYSRAKHAGLTVATERSLVQIALPMKFKAKPRTACEHCGGPGGDWHNAGCPELEEAEDE